MLLPKADERSIVVFKLWPSMAYNRRLSISFSLIALGLILQSVTLSFWTGLVVLIAGNALLLVSGYDNRVDFGRYDPDAEWQRINEDKLNELKKLDRMMKKWDFSTLDITSALGLFIFLLVAGILGIGVIFYSGPLRILLLDAAVLLLPHWMTGIRRIQRLPRITLRINMIQDLLITLRDQLDRHRVHLMMLLTAGETKLPKDLKFKVDVSGHHPDFLGLYGQVVLNMVQGTAYPYFYIVMVSKQGFGLWNVFQEYSPPSGLIKEFKNQGKVEVLVIRQHTTKKSGYHTKFPVAQQILKEGLAVAEKAAAKNELP